MKHIVTDRASAKIRQYKAYLRKRSFISRRTIVTIVMIMPMRKRAPKIAFIVSRMTA